MDYESDARHSWNCPATCFCAAGQMKAGKGKMTDYDKEVARLKNEIGETLGAAKALIEHDEKLIAALQAEVKDLRATIQRVNDKASEQLDEVREQLVAAQAESKANYEAAEKWKDEALRQQEISNAAEESTLVLMQIGLEGAREELLKEKAARMVERAGLDQIRQVGAAYWAEIAEKALSQPAPDAGALIRRLVGCLQEVKTHAERRYPDHACQDCVVGELNDARWRCWLHEASKTLVDIEADLKRMGLDAKETSQT